MKVYLLDMDYENPEDSFSRIYIAPPLDDKVKALFIKSKGESLQDTWARLDVISTSQAPLLDMFILPSEAPVISRWAIAEFGTYLSDHGEFLATEHPDYFLYHPFKFSNSLDIAKSGVHWYDDGEDIANIYAFHFHQDILEGYKGIFKVYEHFTNKYYCTELFKEKWKALGYTGLTFSLVWDSEDPNYQDERWGVGQWIHIKRIKLTLKQRQARGISEAKIYPPLAPKHIQQNQERFAIAPFSPEEEYVVEHVTGNGFHLLEKLFNKDMRQEKPRTVVTYLGKALEHVRQMDISEQEEEDYAIEIGLLWATQLERAYNWHWGLMIGDKFIIMSPDKSLYMDPVLASTELLVEKTKENTMLFVFDILSQPEKLYLQAEALRQLGF